MAVTIGGCTGGSPAPGGATPAGPVRADASSSPSSTPTPAPRLVASRAPWRLPAPRSREVALSTPSGLVVAGGLDSTQVSTATTWTLSPSSGRLRATGSLAVAVHDAAGAVVGHHAFVFAGGNATTVDDVQELGRGAAHVVGHLPTPRSDLNAVTIGGDAFVLGGFDGTTAQPAVLRTDDGHHFTTVAQLRVTVRYGAVAAVVTRRGPALLVFGGEHDGVPVDDVQQVDLGSGRSRVVGHLPHALAHEAAVGFDDGSVWLAGGRSNDRLQSAVLRWDVRRRAAVAAGHLPYAVADAPVAVDGSAAYLLGGETPTPTDRVIVMRLR